MSLQDGSIPAQRNTRALATYIHTYIHLTSHCRLRNVRTSLERCSSVSPKPSVSRCLAVSNISMSSAS